MLDVRWSHRSGYDTVQARWAEGLRRRTFPLLCAVFFLSGFSALVYQTAWQRMLGLFAGSDAVAATLVVGAALLVTRLPDPALTWALRLGVGVALLGLSVGFLLVANPPSAL